MAETEGEGSAALPREGRVGQKSQEESIAEFDEDSMDPMSSLESDMEASCAASFAPICELDHDAGVHMDVPQIKSFPLQFSNVYCNDTPSIQRVCLHNPTDSCCEVVLHGTDGVSWTQPRMQNANSSGLIWSGSDASNTLGWMHHEGSSPMQIRALRHLAANLERVTTLTISPGEQHILYIEVKVRELVSSSQAIDTRLEHWDSEVMMECNSIKTSFPVHISTAIPSWSVGIQREDPDSPQRNDTKRDRSLILDVGDVVVGNAVSRTLSIANHSEIACFAQFQLQEDLQNSSRRSDLHLVDLSDESSLPLISSQKVNTECQPVMLDALGTLNVAVVLEPRSPCANFEQTLTLVNLNAQNESVRVSLRANILGATSDEALAILNECPLDFGDCCGGQWTRQLLVLKNTADVPLDVRFSTEKDVEVTFQLADLAQARDTTDDDHAGDDGIPEMDSGDDEVPLGGTSTSVAAAAADKSQKSNPPSSYPLASTTEELRTPIAQAQAAQTNQVPPLVLGLGAPPALCAEPNLENLVSEKQKHDQDDTSASSNASQAGSRVASPEPTVAKLSSEADQSASTSDFAASTPAASIEPSSTETSSIPSGSSKPLASTRMASYSVNSLTSSVRGAPSSAQRRIHDPVAMLRGSGESQHNQVEELILRPGAQYRVVVSHRPPREPIDDTYRAGRLRETSFRIFLDHVRLRDDSRSQTGLQRQTIDCFLRTCTPFISVMPKVVDFGMAGVGARKTGQIAVTNHSDLSTRILMRFVSKVLSMYMDPITVPARQTVEVKMEFFPRRVNDAYRKQITVMNLLNRHNDQIFDVRARNVDLQRVSFHSLFYRILTRTGSNYLDFGDVNIHSSRVRSFAIENLCDRRLLLEMSVAHAEDLVLYVKAPASNHSSETQLEEHHVNDSSETRSRPSSGTERKERFLETISTDASTLARKDLQEKRSARPVRSAKRSENTQSSTGGLNLAVALKKGHRGRITYRYGSQITFKDCHLLHPLEYLDLASGPPVDASRLTAKARRLQRLQAQGEVISLKDTHQRKTPNATPWTPSKRRPRHSPIRPATLQAKNQFGFQPNEVPTQSRDPNKQESRPYSRTESRDRIAWPLNMPSTPPTSGSTLNSAESSPAIRQFSHFSAQASPALTGQLRASGPMLSNPEEVAHLELDELIAALVNQSANLSTVFLRGLEAEERMVRTEINLQRALREAIQSARLIPIGMLDVPAHAQVQVIAVYTPNGSTRPHIQGTGRKQDSRIFLRLLEFDRNRAAYHPEFASLRGRDIDELPVRDLMVRSTVCRSMLELGQPHINFGAMDKGEQRERKIWIQNRSEWALRYCIRKSGSIASGDIRLGLGRYGVLPGYGKRGVDFTFKPSLSGAFHEKLLVENIADHDNDQNVVLKATVRKVANFDTDPNTLDFGTCRAGQISMPESVLITNTTSKKRSFLVCMDESLQTDVPLDLLIAACRDTVTRRALSREQEEEVETLLQKLKIAQRKGNQEKAIKYQDRLNQLGIEAPTSDAQVNELDPIPTPSTPTLTPTLDDAAAHEDALLLQWPSSRRSSDDEARNTLTLHLAAQQSQKLLLRVRVPMDTIASNVVVGLQVHEVKNSDQMQSTQIHARTEL
ncbi:hypothetical protein MYAM1_002191 [Malassezia yamatoensis]|uniref:Uncharacterized protein n=1 Tax=Malassezia yamatoensis TaxID=253288 RepID=A0AAJ6CGK4_9BASI|nr:hypothetical protein MYAM1_002191 [Malassezia yamatoensis]